MKKLFRKINKITKTWQTVKIKFSFYEDKKITYNGK